MLGRDPRTKETLLDFFLNMDLNKWDTIVWYRVTRNSQEFHGLTGCQRDPRIWGVTDSLRQRLQGQTMAKMLLMAEIKEFFYIVVWLIGSKNWFPFYSNSRLCIYLFFLIIISRLLRD